MAPAVQWAGTPRVLRWGLGGIVLAAAALALLLWTSADRADAADLPVATPVVDVPLPEPVGGVVDDIGATGEALAGTLLDPVTDDDGSVVLPGIGTVDPGALPVVGEVLVPGPVPLPVPGLPTTPDPLPVASAPPALVVAPTGAATPEATATLAGPARAARAGSDLFAPSERPDASAVTTSDPDARDGRPASPAPHPLDPLGTVASAVGGASGPGLLLVAVLAAGAWAAGRGPGRRLVELTAVAPGGPPVPFERPG